VTVTKIARVKEFGKRVYLTFKLWLTSLVSVLVLSIIIGTNLLFFLPLTVRMALVGIYLIVTEIMLFPFVRLITGSAQQIVSSYRYNNRHKPKELYLPNAKQIAEKMNIKYDKPIYVTDNPSVTGPFTNLISGKIYFPLSEIEELHHTENEATFAHELAHIKYSLRFIVEMSLATLATWVFATFLAQFAINLAIFIIAEFAFMMLTFSFVMRRNESRADWAAGKATTPEAVISVLEYFGAKCKVDGDSITHPSIKSRIKRLKRLFDWTNQQPND
jgi:Zn-dependent protease with chaperone function